MPSDRKTNPPPDPADEGTLPALRADAEVLCRGVCRGGRERLERGGPRWLPGVVVVEFRRPVSPELFRQEARAAEVDAEWLDAGRLFDVLGDYHEFVQLKPPEWTFSYAPGAEPEGGRRRFITFYFMPAAPVADIAAALRLVRGVSDAAPEPKLAPPPRAHAAPSAADDAPLLATAPDATLRTRASDASALQAPLLNEPLAISGGPPLGVAIQTAAGIQNQWYLFRCRADAVLNHPNPALRKTGRGVVVADIDWGFRLSHQDLTGRVEFALNVKENNDDVTQGPEVSHGTSVLGLLWGADNDAGMLGFAPGASLWAVQADDGSGSLDNRLWAKAIDCVVGKDSGGRPKVILIEASTEEGGNVEVSKTIREAIVRAIAAGAVVCVAAGNAGINAHFLDETTCCIPPTDSILVGATAYRVNPDVIERGPSNFGPRIDVSAPGSLGADVTCCSCGDNTYTNTFGGTSGAAAKVAGTIALVLEANPTLTHAQVRTILRETGTAITTADKPLGVFLNTEAAVRKADANKQ